MATRIKLEWKEYDTEVTDKIESLLRERPTTLDATATLSDVPIISLSKGQDYQTISAHAILTEDISLDFRSNFTSALDAFGGNSVGSLLQFVTKLQSSVTGTTSELSTLFDYQLWEKTEPIKLNLEVMFTLDTNAELDVWLPTMSLCSLTALTKLPDGGYMVPGIHFGNLKLVSQANRSANPGNNDNSGTAIDSKSDDPLEALQDVRSKFLSIQTAAFESPLMLVNDAKPTFSKHVDETGFPIWSKVQLDLQSLYPASGNQLFRRGR